MNRVSILFNRIGYSGEKIFIFSLSLHACTFNACLKNLALTGGGGREGGKPTILFLATDIFFLNSRAQI